WSLSQPELTSFCAVRSATRRSDSRQNELQPPARFRFPARSSYRARPWKPSEVGSIPGCGGISFDPFLPAAWALRSQIGRVAHTGHGQIAIIIGRQIRQYVFPLSIEGGRRLESINTHRTVRAVIHSKRIERPEACGRVNADV